MGKLAWIPIVSSILGALLVGMSFVADEGSDPRSNHRTWNSAVRDSVRPHKSVS